MDLSPNAHGHRPGAQLPLPLSTICRDLPFPLTEPQRSAEHWPHTPCFLSGAGLSGRGQSKCWGESSTPSRAMRRPLIRAPGTTAAGRDRAPPFRTSLAYSEAWGGLQPRGAWALPSRGPPWSSDRSAGASGRLQVGRCLGVCAPRPPLSVEAQTLAPCDTSSCETLVHLLLTCYMGRDTCLLDF